MTLIGLLLTIVIVYAILYVARQFIDLPPWLYNVVNAIVAIYIIFFLIGLLTGHHGAVIVR